MPRTSRDDDRDSDRGRERGRDDRDDRGRSRDRDDDRGGRGRDRDREDDRGSRRSGGSDYEYAGRTSEENTRRQKQGSSRYDSILNQEVVYYSAPNGENCIRIIPWLNKKFENFDALVEKYGKHWGIDAVIHRKVGADKGTYLCLDKTLGLPCPMCDIWRDDDEEKLKPSDRILCWVIDRKDEKSGPKLWNMPLGTSKDIQAASQDRQTGEWYPVEHPEEGFDIYFDREGEKDRTRYNHFDLAKRSSPLHQDQAKMDKWLAYVMDKPLPELLKTYEEDYILKVLSGQRRDDDDDRSRDRDRNGERGDRSRDRDDKGRDDERSSSRRSDRDDDRGNNRDRDRDDRDSERSSSRRGGRDDDDAEASFSRPARSRGGDDERDDREPDREERGSRSRREPEEDRGSSRRGGDREPADDDASGRESRSSRRGRDDGEKDRDGGGKTERYRPRDDDRAGDKEDNDDGGDDGGDDKEAAKENLRRVGRRGGR